MCTKQASKYVMRTSMRLKPLNMLWFFMVGLYFSCAGPKSAQNSNSQSNQYNEDLAALRQADIMPMENQLNNPQENEVDVAKLSNGETNAVDYRYAVTTNLDNLLEESSRINITEIKSVPGYTIQVYMGTSRDGANLAQRKVYQVLPESRPEIKFVQPNYKVYVGRFVNRLEAQKSYSALRSEFPNALVIPERIRVN